MTLFITPLPIPNDTSYKDTSYKDISNKDTCYKGTSYNYSKRSIITGDILLS